MTCSRCGCSLPRFSSDYCNNCLNEILTERKRKYLSQLTELSIEERLSKIEEYIYNLRS